MLTSVVSQPITLISFALKIKETSANVSWRQAAARAWRLKSGKVIWDQTNDVKVTSDLLKNDLALTGLKRT